MEGEARTIDLFQVDSVSFAFLSGNAFEIAHISCRQRSSKDGQMINACCFATSLVVLDEYHQVLHILEFDEP